MMFPAILYAAYAIDQSYAVVSDFRITTQFRVADGVLVEGVMDKRRNCRLLEIVANIDDSISHVEVLDPWNPKRPIGVQKWGPWLVRAHNKDGVKLFAHYRCHSGWEHTSALTSFVEGAQ